MKRDADEIHLLAEGLNSSVVKAALKWRSHPELSKLVTKLLSHSSPKAFMDSFAEAMVANHLLKHRCDLRFEVATPRGKRCDFEVSSRSDDSKFYLHVKRLDTLHTAVELNRMRAHAGRLQSLERITRPYVVKITWNQQISSSQMRSLVAQAEAFIRQARVGDELAVKDDSKKWIAGVRIMAPWEGKNVIITIGLHRGSDDQAAKFHRLMERAHEQFMPKAVNVVLIASDHVEDAIDFENALLGSHVERWDAFPKRGRRLAHGRAADGFWHGHQHPDSQFACWVHFDPVEKMLRSRLWTRHAAAASEDMNDWLHRLFEKKR